MVDAHKERLKKYYWVGKTMPGRLEPCWIWSGSFNQFGLPMYTYKDEGKHRAISAKRFVYQIYRNDGEALPANVRVYSGCYENACVNPWHHEPGTHGQGPEARRRAIKLVGIHP